MFKFNVVLVCDRSYDRKGVNILSDDLEYTSTKYFNEIHNSLKKLCQKVYVYYDIKDFQRNICKHTNDVIFSAIWSGKYSRNRKSVLAAICEAAGIKYIGADAYVQTICQDKHLSQLYCSEFNIQVPQNVFLQNKNSLEKVKLLKFPVIIKPALEGGSIGISDENICNNFDEVKEKYNFLSQHYYPLLVEEYIAGQEVSACIIGTPQKIYHYEFVKLVINGKSFLENEVWGFESKKCNKSTIERVVISNEVSEEIKENILEIFYSLGKVDYMRIDGRIDKNGNFYLIELTPDCSLHPDCFMYQSFQHYGYKYEYMIKKILELA